uniref:NAD(P)(+)--arginine ADP-ribosyltransferase n=1 Tax=Neogobius melanostomus TaxID=47308 RepID=A0A8C6S555_9GOBI
RTVFLCHGIVLIFITQTPPSNARWKRSSIKDMSEQSVDDRYDGCTEKMAKKVKGEYLPREINNSLFKRGWKKAESCANSKYETRKDKALTKDHLQAICAYTEALPNLYQPFNEAVRRGRPKYNTPAFQYHTLHYWLVSALEILRINKPAVNQIIRFGSFASTSKEPNLHDFGKKTCFHIQTCFGAYLKDYSAFHKREREVLIPPYEMFKIVKIAKGSYEKMTNCNTIFVLKNAGNLSNLNCKAKKIRYRAFKCLMTFFFISMYVSGINTISFSVIIGHRDR